ncbi:MAG: pirin family protein [Planctomycetaceae bacterium]|nr:pirin family protein [Planctomycetaceae bacterium]
MRRVRTDLPSHWVGDGFPVLSVFSPRTGSKALSPFVLFDYAAPHRFEPSKTPRGVGAHPHRGFETVTVVYAGELEHRDSAGNGGRIGPGDVQWMTAARGLFHEEMHSERFTREGGTMEMAQLWVNLPARAKSDPPAYQDILAARIPRVELEGGHLRLIAGTYRSAAGAETTGPARTATPVILWDGHLEAGARAQLPIPDGYSAALFVRRGKASVAGGAKTIGAGELVEFTPEGTAAQVEALEAIDFLVLGGEPIDEPIVAYGPFVMNTEAEIDQAIVDAQSGRM